jgi:integral membrane sensor domain MASE1
MKNNKTSLAVYLLLIILLNAKSCSVSMQEPFSQISFNEIWWQLVIPAGIIGSLLSVTLLLILSVTKENWKKWLIYIVITLLVLTASAVNIHGYFWDLKYHAHIPDQLAN